jgi:hypothetical protein
MTRILLVETASPLRVRKAAEEILAGGVYPDPEVTILAAGDPDSCELFRRVAGVRVVQAGARGMFTRLGELRAERFDVVRIFWTGERAYRWLKLRAFRLGRRATLIDIGDGSMIRLTLPAVVRHLLFRLSHPLPRDHWELTPPRNPALGRAHAGERVLVVQSADPGVVVRALDQLALEPIFRDARYTVFCRNVPETISRFRGHASVSEVRVHDRTRGAFGHLRALRREQFDGALVFFTGDPSYRKIKCFALFLGVRHTLVYNENNDCEFLSWRSWLALVRHRLGEREAAAQGLGIAPLLLRLLKLAIVPFRFVWLLSVWAVLRAEARRFSRRSGTSG